MDLGGIIAGAMAGGGQAIQQNAQGQLEQQRTKALAELEQKFRMNTAEYKQDRADERSTAEAIAEAEQARIDRQAEENLVRLRGDQERRTAEREAELEEQYGTGGDTPAKVREIQYLTENVTGGDREMATRIAYRTEGDFNYADAQQMVLDSIDASPTQNFDITPEEIQQRTDDLFERVNEMNGFGGGQERAPRGRNQSSMFSFRNGNTLIRTPSGGIGEAPDPKRIPDVFQSK